MTKEELIEKYISGRLTSEEKLEFDRLIETDASFREEVRFHKDLKRVTEHDQDEAFKKQLQEYEKRVGIKRRPFIAMGVAASIVLALGSALWIVFQKTPSEKLFAEYYEPYRNVVAPVVRGDDSEDIEARAFSAYEKGSFEEAVTNFETLLSEEENSEYRFYLANSYLALGHSQSALQQLVRYPSNSRFSDKIPWYRALAYLQLDDLDTAKEILQQIELRGTYNYSKAIEILKKLK